MIIENIKVYYVEKYTYLPSVEHVVVELVNAEGEEDGNILRFKNGELVFTDGKMDRYLNKEKSLRLKIAGNGRPINVKITSADIDANGKASLELKVTKDFLVQVNQ